MMARTLKQVEAAVERLNAMYADGRDFELSLERKPGPIGARPWFVLTRLRKPTDEERAQVFKEYEGEMGARTCAAATLARGIGVWAFYPKLVWQLDSLVRMLEGGVEPGDWVEYKRDKPAHTGEDGWRETARLRNPKLRRSDWKEGDES